MMKKLSQDIYRRRTEVRLPDSPATANQFRVQERPSARPPQSVYTGRELMPGERAEFELRMKRLAWKNPGVFFGGQLPVDLVPLHEWTSCRWSRFFRLAGWPPDVAAQFAAAAVDIPEPAAKVQPRPRRNRIPMQRRPKGATDKVLAVLFDQPARARDLVGLTGLTIRQVQRVLQAQKYRGIVTRQRCLWTVTKERRAA